MFWRGIILLLIIFAAGCKDPCKKVKCNLGICDDGKCDCSHTHYEGEQCDTLSLNKFLGYYSVYDTCSSSGAALYTARVKKFESDQGAVLIQNFFGQFQNDVAGYVETNTLSVPTQDPDKTGFKISGTGTYIDSVTLDFTYTIIDDTGNADNCTATWIHQ